MAAEGKPFTPAHHNIELRLVISLFVEVLTAPREDPHFPPSTHSHFHTSATSALAKGYTPHFHICILTHRLISHPTAVPPTLARPPTPTPTPTRECASSHPPTHHPTTQLSPSIVHAPLRKDGKLSSNGGDGYRDAAYAPGEQLCRYGDGQRRQANGGQLRCDDQGATLAFAEQLWSALSILSIRMRQAGFIRKVYSILSMQLLVTVAGAAFFMLHTPTREFVLSTPSMFYAAMFLPIGFIFALMCYKDQHPTNM